MSVFPKGASLAQRSATLRAARLLSQSLGIRIGDTAVASTKVHVQDMRSPQDVRVLFSGDAGKTFYGRAREGEILHLDIFHSEGTVDPRDVARHLRGALAGIRFESEPGAEVHLLSLEPLISYIDLQTAAGGGRLDGDQSYGREEGVRAAHRTHVHLAALKTPETLSSLFAMVAAVEAAIEESGLQLRKVQKVRMARGEGNPVDMKDYQTMTDSLLRNVPDADKNASMYRKEALARQAAKDVGSASESIRILEALARGLRSGEFTRLRPETDKSPEEVRQALTRSRLVRFDGLKYTLTDEGLLALEFLREHCHEIESYLRRLLWSLPSRNVPSSERRGKTREAGQSRGRSLALPKTQAEYAAEISLPETILAGAASAVPRTAFGPDAACHANRATEPFRIAPGDLRFSYVRARSGSPIILLLDASASMTGRRIAAAKELARHLVLTGKDKVSVVSFQDTDVKTVCDFTRSLRRLDEGLRSVQAMGLTPMARGLERALELSFSSVRRPLVLCVTDGIPTVPSRSLSPIDDALDAARRLAKRGIRVGCIGLEPNQSFLRELVAAAKGTLYVVTELEASTMAAIARRERKL